MMLRTSAIAERRTSQAPAIDSSDATTCALSVPTPQTDSRSICTATSLSSNASNRPELTEPLGPWCLRLSTSLLPARCHGANANESDHRQRLQIGTFTTVRLFANAHSAAS